MKRLIIVPASAADEALDGTAMFNDIMGSMNSGDSEAPAQEAASETDVQPPVQGEAKDSNAQQPAQHTQEEKQQYAWTEMSRANKQLTTLLGKIADANGIKYDNSKDLIDKLSDDAINKMAERQNVPVELLRKIEALQADSDAYKRQQIQNNAAVGFQQLQTQFGLDQQALEQFAVELNNAGKNPFEKQVDIIAEYKAAHFNEILQAQVAAAVEEALKRDGSVSQQSSQPVQKQGGSSDAPDTPTISSQRDFQSFLNGIM